MKVKLIYIISNFNKSFLFEGIAEELAKMYDLHFIILNPGDSHFQQFLQKIGVTIHFVKYCGKEDIFKAAFKVLSILKKSKPDIIHTHLLDASLVGLSVGKLLCINKRITTRHHSTEHHLFSPKGIYYDKLINYLATDIVCISKSVKNVLLQEGAAFSKLHLIHHGFRLEKFHETSEERIQHIINKYNLGSSKPVIGVISRYVQAKGIQFIIPAFKELLITYPDAVLILANAKGDFKSEIQKALDGIPVANYREIEFENDIFTLYHIFDVFIHVPIYPDYESFGQIYIEALAAEVPSVFTLSGVAPEFIKHNQNAYVVKYSDSEEIYAGLITLLQNKQLAESMKDRGKQDINQLFHLDTHVRKLRELYEK